MMNILGKTATHNIDGLIDTAHNVNERDSRTYKIKTILGGYGKPLCSFIVDKGHPNGNEVHTITDKGVIVIQNERTEKLITNLIAREGQIRRYFDGIAMPIEMYAVIEIAKENHRLGRNNW